MTSRFTATATVPTGTVSGAAGRPLFSDIQRAFPGLAGSASNLMSDYFARHPSLAPPAALSNVVGARPPTQLFSHFMGLTALTPTFGALSNVAVAPDNAGLSAPVNGTNAVFLAGGLLTALVGPSYHASLSVDLIGYLDNRRFHLGTGTCAFVVDAATTPNPLPVGAASIASTSLGTLALSTSSVTAYNVPVVFRCTNFYGNWGTFTIALNLVPAPYASGLIAAYVGESFCPVTGQWADVTGQGHTAVVSGGAASKLWTLNGRAYVAGTTATAVTFPVGVLPSSAYTLLHVAKYNGVNKQRILTSAAAGTDWLSGHSSGWSGVAKHGNWVTPTTDEVGTTWALSSDQADLYRVNGIQRGGSSGGGANAWCQLGVNTYGSEQSDWAIAFVAIYPTALSASQIFDAERALASQYGIAFLAASIGGSTVTTNAYTADLSSIFDNCSGYAVAAPPGFTSDPQSSAAVSSSTVTVTGANRNTSYTVWVSGSSAAGGGSVAYQSFTMREYQQPPTSSGIGGRTYVTGSTSTDAFDVSASFAAHNGSSATYSVSGDNSPSSSGSTIYYTPAQRNAAYAITVTLTTRSYDGVNVLSTSQNVAIAEYQNAPTSSAISGRTYGTGNSSADAFDVSASFAAHNGSSATYSVSGDNSPSSSGSTVSYTPAQRNAAYAIAVTLTTYSYGGVNAQSTSQSVAIVEYQKAPTSSVVSDESVGTGSSTWNVSGSFVANNGNSPTYTISGANASIDSTSGVVTYSAAYRNAGIRITVTLTTNAYTGGNPQSTSQDFTVTESDYPVPTFSGTMSLSLGEDTKSINLDSYFNGYGATRTYTVWYSPNSNCTISGSSASVTGALRYSTYAITIRCTTSAGTCNADITVTESDITSVYLYNKINYAGTAVKVGKGSYGDFDALGVGNDSLASIRIPHGWIVHLYQDHFGGYQFDPTASVADITTAAGWWGVSSMNVV